MTTLEVQTGWNLNKPEAKRKWANPAADALPSAKPEELVDRQPQRTGESREATEPTFRRSAGDSSASMYRRFLSRNWLGN